MLKVISLILAVSILPFLMIGYHWLVIESIYTIYEVSDHDGVSFVALAITTATTGLLAVVYIDNFL